MFIHLQACRNAGRTRRGSGIVRRTQSSPATHLYSVAAPGVAVPTEYTRVSGCGSRVYSRQFAHTSSAWLLAVCGSNVPSSQSERV